MTIHAVIFDLDGTLANSEPIYRESETWLAESLNIQSHIPSSEDFIGSSSDDYMQWFRDTHQVDLSVSELCVLQSKIFLEKGIQKVRPFRPTIDFLKSLHINQIPLALASGSEPEIIEAMIMHLRIDEYFGSVLSSRHVGKSKPAPDVFLESAKRLSQSPEHCLVIEDSIPGMQAAQNAGMPVITINSQFQFKANSAGKEAASNIAASAQNEAQGKTPNKTPQKIKTRTKTLAEERIEALRKADLFFPSMQDFNLTEILQKFQIQKA